MESGEVNGGWRPPRFGVLSGNNGSIRIHCASVNDKH